MPVISTTKMTARQFLHLGEDPPGVRLELVEGEVAVSPSPIPAHSFVDTRLRTVLSSYVQASGLGMIFGDVDTLFGEHDVRRPDIIYVSNARRGLIGKAAVEGPPDLCVEILSPSSVQTDREDKFKQYAEGGVRDYWIVDPESRTIEAYHLTGRAYQPIGRGANDQRVRFEPFPELEINLADLWFPPRETN